MTNGRSLMIYRSLFRRKRRQQSLDHPVEENQHFAIRRTAGNEELICLANFSEYGQNGEENEKI